MNIKEFQKKVFTPDGRTRWWAHLICLFVASTMDVMLMMRIEPSDSNQYIDVIVVALEIFAGWSLIYLPIQHVLRYAFLSRFPYITTPLLVYLGINIFMFLAFVGDMVDTVPVLFDSAMLGFLHFPMLFYILFSTVLHQFSPVVMTQQTRTDILDDL
jgi:hypothetical protein